MEKEPHWIGHRTAERRQTESGFLYRDPDNQSLAIMLGISAFHAADSLFDGANLWEVDRFVEGLEARNDPAAGKYRARLNLIRDIYKNGDLKACLPHADVINAGMQAQEKLEGESRLREALELVISRTVAHQFAAETASEQLREPHAESGKTNADVDASGRSQAGTDCVASIVRHTIKTRRNTLDPAIDKAITKAGGRDANAVFNALRDMALAEESPFTGFTEEGGALQYLNDKGEKVGLTKSALSARLRRRQATPGDDKRR